MRKQKQIGTFAATSAPEERSLVAKKIVSLARDDNPKQKRKSEESIKKMQIPRHGCKQRDGMTR